MKRLLLVALLIFSRAEAQTRTQLVDIEPDTLTARSTTSLPGVFRLDETSNAIVPLCIPSNGSWVRPGYAPCPTAPGGAAPPPALRYLMPPPRGSGITWVVANLGVDQIQWEAAQSAAGDPAVAATSLLKMIGAAASLRRAGDAVSWSIDSAKLPPGLIKEVPGGGIFMHAQDILPGQQHPFADGGVIEVSAQIGLPDYKLIGAAGCGVSIGVSLQAPDSTGRLWPVPLLVGIFNSKNLYGERVASDGRNVYVASSLSHDPGFVTPATAQQLAPGRADQVFTFRMTGANVTALIAALNQQRAEKDLPPLSTDVALVRLHQLDLRNEIGRLDRGAVRLTLRIGFLRADAVTG